MQTLVVGATGATGHLLVEQLLDRGQEVTVIVRSPEKLPEAMRANANLHIVGASLLDLTDVELAHHVRDCRAIASCLGHNMTLKGMYGQPRRLVADAVRRLCQAVKANQPDTPTKYVLMNTAGNRNPDHDEPIALGQQLIIGTLRVLLPPHVDNEDAAEYLRSQIGANDAQIEWVVVRPDNLIDVDQVTPYTLHPSPTRSAIFDPGKTSRINVAHFMAELITNQATWAQWKAQMPVIYNQE